MIRAKKSIHDSETADCRRDHLPARVSANSGRLASGRGNVVCRRHALNKKPGGAAWTPPGSEGVEVLVVPDHDALPVGVDQALMQLSEFIELLDHLAVFPGSVLPLLLARYGYGRIDEGGQHWESLL
jgi:hypothetical protein